MAQPVDTTVMEAQLRQIKDVTIPNQARPVVPAARAAGSLGEVAEMSKTATQSRDFWGAESTSRDFCGAENTSRHFWGAENKSRHF